LLLLLLRSGSSIQIRSGFFSAIATATPATPSGPLPLGLRGHGRLLLRRPLLLRRTLRLWASSARRTLRTAVPSTLALLLLRAPILALRTCAAAAVIPLRVLLAGALLELLYLPLHVLADGAVLAGTHFVETAVRAALPALGIGLPAGCAEDAFGQRHWRAGRIVHFRQMGPRDDAARRKTLRTLIELAGGSNPADCWDDTRAEDLLRSQSTPEEVRELGMSEEMISRVWGVGSGEWEKPNADANTISDPPLPAPHTRSFTVRVSARFEAAHFLREYRGISEPLHGHSYKVEADLAARGGGIDGDAIAVDFVSARRKLEALAKTLDYGCINDVPPFDRINPSAENIAEWFARELGAAVAGEDAVVQAVTIWEGPVNSVTFRP
jgi:6-pyruvoyltetrahydropterin/6-carboxytetrahydropterin synthase